LGISKNYLGCPLDGHLPVLTNQSAKKLISPIPMKSFNGTSEAEIEG